MSTPHVWDFAPELAIRFAENVLKLPAGIFDPATGLLVVQDGMPIASCVYHNYREVEHGSTIEGTIASVSPRWATRKVLRAMFDYPFVRVGAVRFQAVTRPDNASACKLLERLGFSYEGCMRNYWDGSTDALMYSVLRHECRWLGRDSAEPERQMAAE